jgi:hypothetical protein
MKCYRCDSEDLILAGLWPRDKETFPAANIVLRLCRHCGLEQNHCGDDETIEPEQAVKEAPSY